MPIRRQNIRGEIETLLKSAGVPRGCWVRSADLQRAAPADDGGFEWILTSEKPTVIFDWERMEFVEEILLADGMMVPANNQVVLLDSHNRFSIKDVLGHVEQFADASAGEYPAKSGKVFFADDTESLSAKGKVEGGHITDGSVGYQQLRSVWVPAGEQASVGGRLFDGPVRLTYSWLLREFSITPIGADVLAKVRLLSGA